MAKADLTAARVRELFEFDPTTGVLRRLVSVKRNAVKAGTPITSINSDGYLRVKIDRHCYVVHRVVWLHHYGCWPAGLIDHINGDKTDNRIANLRDATYAVNSQNTRRAHSDKASGLPLGVCTVHIGARPFRAMLTVKGHLKHLGCFATAEEAHAAYLNAKRALHEGCVI